MNKILPFIIIIFLQSCFYFHTEVSELSPEILRRLEPYRIQSPVKVHLNNGELIVYKNGFILEYDTLYGAGIYYNTLRDTNFQIYQYPFDHTAYYEYYTTEFEPETMIMSTPAALIGSSLLLIAIFGSCPTVYSFSDTGTVLEAECFSYSVAEMFEQPDLDKLNFTKQTNNRIKINLTNEALETHYIDKFNLVYVDHEKKYSAYPTDEEEIILTGDFEQNLSINDRFGTSIKQEVMFKDSLHFRTDERIVNELQNRILTDWIDIEIDIPEEKEEAALVMNYRNTLLNTILLYDVMLSSQGAEALDWIGDQTGNLWYAYNFDKWYRSHFGIHIKVFEDGEYSEVYRLGDTGPIIWHESAVKIPLPEGKKLKLRLEFLPDNFMIDQIGLSFDLCENYDLKEINMCSMLNTKQKTNISTKLMNEDDDEYFITYPGENYEIYYDVSDIPKDKTRSFFIASDGYYIEWIRKDWIDYGAGIEPDKVFRFGDEAIKQTAVLWKQKRSTFEKHFHESKIK